MKIVRKHKHMYVDEKNKDIWKDMHQSFDQALASNQADEEVHTNNSAPKTKRVNSIQIFRKYKRKYVDYSKKEVHHKTKCAVCNKPLRRFRLRKDGSNKKDWKSRTMHLKCLRFKK